MSFDEQDKPCYAIIDSGATSLAGSSVVVNALQNVVQSRLERYHVDSSCGDVDDHKEDLRLTFDFGNGAQVELAPRQFTRSVKIPRPRMTSRHDTQHCVPRIVSLNNLPHEYGNVFVLGAPIFQNYMVAFNVLHGKVGFGRHIFADD